MEPDTWASLPCDLLVEIVLRRRLDSAAVLRCAGTCRSWRRAIIANASCFDAVDLIGFFDVFRYVHHHPLQLQRNPGESASACALTADDDVTWARYPPPYKYPLSSRDGIALLGGGFGVDGLCLCNPIAGICRVLPEAAPDMFLKHGGMPEYVLVTGRDVSPSAADNSAVWVLAVKRGRQESVSGGMTFQIFSSASGEWGPVKRSVWLEEEGDHGTAYMLSGPKEVAVCRGGAVYWLGELTSEEGGRSGWRRCAFGMDVRTERTWTTRFPEKYAVYDGSIPTCFIAMATSEDSRRLSLIVALPRHRMEVWELIGGDGEWTLRRTMDLHHPPCSGQGYVSLRSFYPRSRWLLGEVDGNLYLIPVDEDCPCPMAPIRWVEKGYVSYHYPYEMDWSTYVSKMKYFQLSL